MYHTNALNSVQNVSFVGSAEHNKKKIHLHEQAVSIKIELLRFFFFLLHSVQVVRHIILKIYILFVYS